MNTTNKSTRPGRPMAQIKFPNAQKTFTVNDVIALNPTIHKVTVYNHIKSAVAEGTYTKLEKKVFKDTQGAPNALYLRTSVLNKRLQTT